MDKNRVLLQEYKIITRHILHEDSLKWTKLNYYMLINGVLLAAFTTSIIPANPVVQMLICIVGLSAAFVWETIFTRAILGGKARIKRAIAIEKELKIDDKQILRTYDIYPGEVDHKDGIRGKTFKLWNPDRSDVFNAKAAQMLRIIPLLFVFLWTALLLLSIFFRGS